MLMIIVGALAGGLLILMLVIVITITCHHKRKNERLEKELTEKRYKKTSGLLNILKVIVMIIEAVELEENVKLCKITH